MKSPVAKNLVLGCLGITLAAALVALAIRRSGPSAEMVRREAETERARVEAAQKIYRTSDEATLLRDALIPEGRLTQILVEPLSRVLEPARALPLLDEMVDFLRLRIAGDSPEAYVGRRLSEGYAWRPYAELVDWGIAHAYTVRTGRPWSPTDDPLIKFSEMWRSGLTWKGAVNVPRGIVADQKAVGVRLGKISNTNPVPAVPFKDIFPLAIPDDTGSFTSVQWLTPARDRKVLLRTYPEVEFAAVGVLIEYGDGSRRPLVLTYLWDPAEGRWIHDSLSVSAGLAAEILGIDY